MATLYSGLGGAGYGEQSFRTTPLSGGNLDDGFTAINITSVFGPSGINFNGTNYTSVFLGSNGLITFGSGVTGYTPGALTSLGQPVLAPFWTDIDINKGGEIYWDFDVAAGKFTVTWLNVAPYSGSGTTSFQVQISNLGGGDVNVEYLYNSVGWTNGGSGVAAVGTSNGTTQTLVEGSGDATFLATYAGNDFDTNNLAGVYSMALEGGQMFYGDGAVDGTAGGDLINTAYLGDPDGDRIDRLDGQGYMGTSGEADYVLAGAGDDTVQSGLGNDIVYGGSGNDQITTAQGNDWVDGGSENDSVDGGSGNDTLYGGTGDDTLTGGADSTATTYTPAYVEINVSANQTLTGTSTRPNFSVQTVSGDNDLTAGTNGGITGFRLGNGDGVETHTHTASSQIAGGQINFNAINGTETLTIAIDGVVQNLNTAIAAGTVTFTANATYAIDGAGRIIRIGSGAASTNIGSLVINVPYTSVALTSAVLTGNVGLFYEYFVSTVPVNIAAATGGNDQLFGGAGNDSIDGGNGNDSLSGDDGIDTLNGGDGNDTLSGGIGADTLMGDAGNDSLAGGDGADLLNGGLGNDSASGDAGDDTIYGDVGNDSLLGGADQDLIYGGNDADTLNGEAGNDTLYGDAGTDSLLGGTGNDLIYGGTEADTLSGEAGDDVLFGDAGADSLFGGADNDALMGGADNDTLSGDAGADQVYGGDGNDSVAGGTGNDTLWGDLNDDIVSGDAGNDLLFGGDGNDSLAGGTENDTLAGGLGSDTLAGGSGMDYADYSASNTGVSVDLAAGTASGGHAAGDSLISIEGLLGSAYDDTLLGFDAYAAAADPFTNVFFGNAGNDYLDGRAGNDSLYGGADNDTVLGGAGADLIEGGAGNDLLNGGAGADVIDGGTGNDTITVATGTEPFGDTAAGGENSGDNDVLDLTAWGWALTNVVYDIGNPENGTVQFLDGAGAVIGSMTFTGIEQVVPCFTPGTMITTARGEVLVQDLRAGDLVMTRDGGLQPIRWVGQRSLSLADLIVQPRLQPVQIARGALGHGLPLRDMKVSPQHRMVMEGARPEMLFGEAEVLVAATHLTMLPGVSAVLTAGVTYIHLLFDRHEIICANGSWTESFQPAMRMLDGMDNGQRDELEALFPELVGEEFDYPAARLSLKAHEARVLLAA